jgi:hypothetical protein
LFILFHPFVANAEELEAPASETDTEYYDTSEDSNPDNSDDYNSDEDSGEDIPTVITVYANDDNDSLEERVNDLEKRLERYEIDHDEIVVWLTELSDYNAEQDSEKKTISEKLDLIIAGLVEIIDNQNEYLEKYDEQQLTQSDFNDLLTEYFSENSGILQSISDNTLVQADLSVSGNTLITDTNNILKTSSEENQQANKDNMTTYVETSTEHTVYILIFIAIVVGAIFGLILSSHLKKGT